MKKGIFIPAFIIGIAIGIGLLIYFGASISSTYPPIKKYEYPSTFSQLISAIHNYASIDSAITFKITDTTGYKEDGYAIYLDIETKINRSNIEYDIKCEEHNSNDNLYKTEISLVGAIDKTLIIGGYSKDAKGIKPLVDEFDLNVIKPLNDNQNIKIIPL